ncbi:MFS transporter [Streptomyces palmae]|uniref:MFS transporter n=1 Tax=Streptomyces palmae TaxID=1701085 RepID=UPI001FD7E4BE|nr:MFS transporter [Streptomyces palmae]
MSEAVVSPVRVGRLSIGALGILALALGTLQSVVEPALPLLQRELGVSPSEGALVANTMLVTGAVVAPVAGKLGDRHGGKWVLSGLMAVVSVGGLLASLAPNLPVLLLGQVLQGVMVGAPPLSFILVRKHLPAGESQVAIGLVTALFTGGGMVGTSIAGPVAEGLSWHGLFALPTIAIIATTLVLTQLMPHDPPIPSGDRIDWPGVALLSGALLALMLGLVTVTSADPPAPAVGAIAVVVAALATGWVVVERRTASPMVDPRTLAQPAMWHACVLTFVITTSSGMVLSLLPQLFAVSADGYGFGASTTDIGLFLMPGAIAGAVSDSVGGIAARRFGPLAVVIVGTVARRWLVGAHERGTVRPYPEGLDRPAGLHAPDRARDAGRRSLRGPVSPGLRRLLLWPRKRALPVELGYRLSGVRGWAPGTDSPAGHRVGPAVAAALQRASISHRLVRTAERAGALDRVLQHGRLAVVPTTRFGRHRPARPDSLTSDSRLSA